LGDVSFEIQVVGISLNNEHTVILSSEDFPLVEKITLGPYASVLVKSSNNYKKDASIIKPYVGNIENIKNHKLHTYYNFIKTYDNSKIYVLILTGLFILVTVVLLFYYINDILYK